MAATGNPASQRVAERCGFTREAVLRSYMVSKTGRDDMVAFGLLATRTSEGRPATVRLGFVTWGSSHSATATAA